MREPGKDPYPHLVRGLGLASATSVVSGTVIGSGVFLVATDIAQVLPSALGAIAVWIAAGLLSMMGGLILAELGAAYPGTGGPYLYLKEAFHPLAGFLNGWSISLIVQPGSIAAVAVAFAQFFSSLVPLTPLEIKLLAGAVVVAFTGINSWGLRAGAGVMNILTALKILAILGIGAVGFLIRSPLTAPFQGVPGWSASGFGTALIAAFWAYDGWNNISFIAGEIERPQRNIPLALVMGIGVVMALYVTVNAAFLRFLTPTQIAASALPAAAAARAIGGEWAVRAILVAVALSTLGCVNGLVLAGARVTYAMAEGGGLPRFLAYVHPMHRVPYTALLAQMAVALVLIGTGSFAQLFTCVISAAFIFYGLSAVALIVLRVSRPDLERPYRVPLYPWLPLIYTAFTLLFLANAFWTKPAESLVGLGIVILGIPVYFACRRQEKDAAKPSPG